MTPDEVQLEILATLKRIEAAVTKPTEPPGVTQWRCAGCGLYRSTVETGPCVTCGNRSKWRP